MTGIKASLASNIWRIACEPARRRLSKALIVPQAAQQAVLNRILHDHSSSEYGVKYGLLAGMTMKDFRDAVPVCRYDDLQQWVERMKSGEANVLFTGRAKAFERSSGSTAAAKWIPFNDGLRVEFQEAVRAWMGDLYRRNRSLCGGRAWWVVSPLADHAMKTSAGIPVGLASDDEYLGRCEKIFASWLRVGTGKAAGSDWQQCLQDTADELIKARDLRLISVWNPSYLLILWELIQKRCGGNPDPREIWPNLTIISAWADAGAAGDAPKLRKIFPHVRLQGKGLLATEGVITLPWGDDDAAPVPALSSHFLEFQQWPNGDFFLIHELQQGESYEVILTTSGGLWRYLLGDVVRVEGMEMNTPRLRLIGRADGVCDLRGEKLNPLFVAQVFAKFTKDFALLSPCPSADPPHYVLSTTNSELSAVQVDHALRENPYYDHARSVGQLGALRKFLVKETEPARAYMERCIQLGQRAGTIKATAMHVKPGWETWFKGGFAP